MQRRLGVLLSLLMYMVIALVASLIFGVELHETIAFVALYNTLILHSNINHLTEQVAILSILKKLDVQNDNSRP